MGSGSSVSRAVVFSALNTLFTRVVTVIVVAVVVRLVTPEEFGTYAVAITVFTIISGFSELGLAAILARHDLDPDEIGPTVSALSLITGTGLMVLLYVTAGPLAEALGAPDAKQPLQLLSLSVFMVGLFAVPAGLLTRNFRQDALLTASLVSAIPNNALCIWLAAEGQGAMAFAWSRVVGHLITGVVLFAYARKFYWPRLQRRHLRTVGAFGANFGGANLVRYVLLNADYLFVGKLLGPAALGIYTLAFQVGSWASSVLTSVLNNVAMPALSREAGERGRLRFALGHSIVLVSLIAFPIAGFSAVLARPIVLVLYGERWLEAAPLLAVLSVYGAMFVLALLLGNVLVATGRSGKLLVLQLAWLATLVPTMLLGVEVGGLFGAAAAHIVVTALVVLPAHLVPVRKLVDTPGILLLRSVATPLLLTLVAAAAGGAAALLVGNPIAQLLLGGTTASLLYLVLALPLLRHYLPPGVASRLDSPRVTAALAPVLRPVAAIHHRLSGQAVPADGPDREPDPAASGER